MSEPSAYAKKAVFGGHTLYSIGSGMFKIDGRVPDYKEGVYVFMEKKLDADRLQDLRLWLGMDGE